MIVPAASGATLSETTAVGHINPLDTVEYIKAAQLTIILNPAGT